MHIILETVGTDGDVFPYLGLGAALHARGHRVTLAAPETYRASAQTLGIEFHGIVTVAEIDQVLADPCFWHPLWSGTVAARWGSPMIPASTKRLLNSPNNRIAYSLPTLA